MQITLTQSGDYAVRVVLVLARRAGEGLLKAREVAEETDIPVRYLPQIMAALVHAGFLEATAGRAGGYRLARPASEISLLDLIREIEGPLRRERCVLQGGPCDWESVCPLHLVWHEVESDVERRLGAATFADLAVLDEAIEAGALPIPSDTHGRSVPRRGLRPAAPEHVETGEKADGGSMEKPV